MKRFSNILLLIALPVAVVSKEEIFCQPRLECQVAKCDPAPQEFTNDPERKKYPIACISSGEKSSQDLTKLYSGIKSNENLMKQNKKQLSRIQKDLKSIQEKNAKLELNLDSLSERNARMEDSNIELLNKFNKMSDDLKVTQAELQRLKNLQNPPTARTTRPTTTTTTTTTTKTTTTTTATQATTKKLACADSCSFGANCKLRKKWSEVDNALGSASGLNTITVNYAGNSISCSFSPRFSGFELKWVGKCEDRKHSQLASSGKWRSASTAGRQAAVNLVKSMIARKIYPTPCDPQNFQ